MSVSETCPKRYASSGGIQTTKVSRQPQYWRFCLSPCTLCSTKIKRPEILLSPELEVTWCTAVIIIRVVLPSPYLCNRGVSLSSIHYNQSRRVYINQRHQNTLLIWS